ncbi:MetQ/NlpA family lipoprotein [Moraxella equi]|uniref:Lipoprotein n=1 Tax=Moraxella equi TaxID=60442 RepID=A0A378QT97_9GAMM|nr:MetQ/NlpA family lipoprotein [Moraxella equi]OPH37217.1 methionine ABC transporter substrate-binding protein MetQ [Moraxella equi]STZ04085.1 28 kDa outer membrane protein [Moraxella equi]
MKANKFFGLCALASGIALVGCGGDKPTQTDTTTQTTTITACPTGDPNKIKVGVMSGPEHKVAEVAAKVAQEKYGLVVEYVEFNDYALPNTAVSKCDLDANAMQHKPYLDKDSQEKKLDNLVIVGNTFVYPLAGYSKKIKSISELKDGAIVAVPNDPSNLARALILLEKQGLIKLKDNTNLFSTSLDIVENPKKLEIKEVDTSVAARALDDVDLAVVNNTYAGQVGLTANDGVFVEDKDSPYVNIIVARADNKDSDAIKNFVQAYQSDEVEAEAKNQFKDGVVKGW